MKFNFFKWEIQVQSLPEMRYRIQFYVPDLMPGCIHRMWDKSKKAALSRAVAELDEYSMNFEYPEYFAEIIDEWTGKTVFHINTVIHEKRIEKYSNTEVTKL